MAIYSALSRQSTQCQVFSLPWSTWMQLLQSFCQWDTNSIEGEEFDPTVHRSNHATFMLAVWARVHMLALWPSIPTWAVWLRCMPLAAQYIITDYRACCSPSWAWWQTLQLFTFLDLNLNNNIKPRQPTPRTTTYCLQMTINPDQSTTT